MMTFAEYIRKLDNYQPQFTRLPNGCIVVYSVDPQLWQLSDYVVSSRGAHIVYLVNTPNTMRQKLCVSSSQIPKAND